ncbi:MULTISPECIES: DUF4123 domain-containing protein [Rhizobium/Agrobacterium group]|uniref:DUF4123 domain-containing protein n=1 Tax=Rhizobium rhizogenes TaxID=359 RepID=A0AA92H8E0_RHIRH|nr:MULTISPECIES: DUF4123 domain-containing protein [Rhizobium/Agrobacterium group]PVE52370.1 hypothetical protein DC430_16150 [Rhizobium rhizogenes]PVE63085.1 hypothetical protein DC415_20390 [Agrobacterium tumefaciens]PVE71978.1 hypothetical protein DCP16_20390 [Sphingomonas sp. TPD3009]
MSEALKKQIQNELMQPRAAGSNLFVLIDPSRNPGLLTIAQGMTDEGACLFIGDARQEFEDDAPWLVRCDEGGEFVRYLVSEGLGRRWSVFVESDLEFAQIFTHFRKFVKVVDGDGDHIFWRFYDPMIISGQLPFLTVEQRQHFLNGIERLGTEMGEHAFAWFRDNADGRLSTHVLEENNESIDVSDNEISDVKDIPSDLVQISVDGARIRPMMHLTQSQIDAPLLYNRPALVAHVVENLDEEFHPALAQVDRQVLDQMISHGISLAMFSYAIHDVEHIELFIDFMFRIAPGWHKEPTLNQILRRTDITTDEKFNRMAEDRMAGAWDDAETLDDPREWLPQEIARQLNAEGELLQ